MDGNLTIETLSKRGQFAFSQLYNVYSKPILNNILRIVKQEEEANDILQNVFLKLLDRCETISTLSHSEIKSWLFRVSYNDAISFLRHQLKEKESLRDLIQLNNNNDGSDENEERLLTKLREAILLLPPRKKQVIELCKMNGKTYVEAASIMGISQHTVKEHLSESIKFIRNYLLREQVFFLLYFITILSKT